LRLSIVRIAVCVVTYQRPRMLGSLLDGLSHLTFQGPPPEWRIVVVDNDSAGSARAVCDRARPRFLRPLRYCIEPRRGISYARNTAVRCAGEAADFIAFIDDDEVPHPTWLDELLRAQALYHADVVAGPAVPRFVEDVPEWITRGRLFHHPRYPTGRRLRWVATNNVLVRRQVFDRMEQGFDARFGLSGGEDRHFFLRTSRVGFKIVWADKAVVFEPIPASRANVRWLLLQKYHHGANTSFIELELRRSPLRYARVAAEGCALVIAGLLLAPWSLLAGRHAAVQCLREVCRGAGMLAGIGGKRHERYRRTDGE
jgi:glycosyltransferase involved in cell wall biosynthesis